MAETRGKFDAETASPGCSLWSGTAPGQPLTPAGLGFTCRPYK